MMLSMLMAKPESRIEDLNKLLDHEFLKASDDVVISDFDLLKLSLKDLADYKSMRE